jgi:DNA-directed RNA polymerase specialized sigma24 family protein
MRFCDDIALAARRALCNRGVVSPDAILDDLLQDTYMKLHDPERNPLSRFEPTHPASVRAFLRVVTMNLVYDHLRVGRRETSHVAFSPYEESQDRLLAPSQAGGSPFSIERGILLEQ